MVPRPGRSSLVKRQYLHNHPLHDTRGVCERSAVLGGEYQEPRSKRTLARVPGARSRRAHCWYRMWSLESTRRALALHWYHVRLVLSTVSAPDDLILCRAVSPPACHLHAQVTRIQAIFNFIACTIRSTMVVASWDHVGSAGRSGQVNSILSRNSYVSTTLVQLYAQYPIKYRRPLVCTQTADCTLPSAALSRVSIFGQDGDTLIEGSD